MFSANGDATVRTSHHHGGGDARFGSDTHLALIHLDDEAVSHHARTLSEILSVQFTVIGDGFHVLPHFDGFGPISKCSTPPAWICSQVTTGISSCMPFNVAD